MVDELTGFRKRVSANMMMIIGSPHTGKTTRAINRCFALTNTRYTEKSRAGKLARLVEEGRVVFTVFDKNMGYGEFVEKELEIDNETVVRDGILKNICNRAAAEQQKCREGKKRARNYVLVIRNRLDNVADVMKVWGGSFVLLRDYEKEVELPYSHSMLHIPYNLYVILICDYFKGDPNGQDEYEDDEYDEDDEGEEESRKEEIKYFFDKFRIERSKVEYGIICDISYYCGKMAEKINKKLDRYDNGWCVGHGYFMGARTVDDIIRIMRKKVLPVLLLGDRFWYFGVAEDSKKDCGEHFFVNAGAGLCILSGKIDLFTVISFVDEEDD